jgi:hypothetical protein
LFDIVKKSDYDEFHFHVNQMDLSVGCTNREGGQHDVHLKHVVAFERSCIRIKAGEFTVTCTNPDKNMDTLKKNNDNSLNAMRSC